MSDHPLFDLARPGDPATSHAGAATVRPRLSGLRAEFVERLRRLGEATAAEVANGCESIRKRKHECVRAGWIVKVGQRVCRVTGNRAETFRVSEETNES